MALEDRSTQVERSVREVEADVEEIDARIGVLQLQVASLPTHQDIRTVVGPLSDYANTVGGELDAIGRDLADVEACLDSIMLLISGQRSSFDFGCFLPAISVSLPHHHS